MMNVNITKYVVKDESLQKYGATETFVYEVEGVEYAAYSGYGNGGKDMTLAEYMKRESSSEFRIVSPEELDKMIEAVNEKRKEEIKEIDESDFWWLLECLPPCRHQTFCNVEMFHMSERISHDLVHWVGKIGERYFKLVDSDKADLLSIAKRFTEFAKNNQAAA